MGIERITRCDVCKEVIPEDWDVLVVMAASVAKLSSVQNIKGAMTLNILRKSPSAIECTDKIVCGHVCAHKWMDMWMNTVGFHVAEGEE